MNAPSLRPDIDLLYNLEHIINPSRLTKALSVWVTRSGVSEDYSKDIGANESHFDL